MIPTAGGSERISFRKPFESAVSSHGANQIKRNPKYSQLRANQSCLPSVTTGTCLSPDGLSVSMRFQFVTANFVIQLTGLRLESTC
jgi:hypothetical protein